MPNFSGKGSFLLTKNFKRYSSQTLDLGAGPLLPLPAGFNNYTVRNATFTGTFNGTTEIKLNCPTANDPLTKYSNECLQTYFTIEFVKLVDQLPFPATQPFLRDDRLEYAISLYNTIYKLPLATIDYSVRYTLSYYLSPPFSIFLISDPETQAKLTKLKDLLKSIEDKYNAVLIQRILPQTVTDARGNPPDKPLLDYFNTQRGGKVLNQAEAQTFIEQITEGMKIEIDVFFAEAQIRVGQFNTDPYISDPRFRMSIVDPRWNEYDETIKREVAFYNQKFAGVANYVPLDWRIVKAMVWSEVMAGPDGNPTEWQTRPMQIGVTGDPGFQC